jgi:hypothetical protein
MPSANRPISLAIFPSIAKTDSLRRAENEEGAKTTSRQAASWIGLTRVKGIAVPVL